ncbi:uncharacterized protein (TIGR02453 family) [Hamadaea flava]|uniref:DUF2461 domain-containing protein n=1 Tax=Hamadaea flava TaxID=1742688 RepID=A0ABV8LTN4_9ACTN|nr:DUF2461 domain-containing protein [Hamadaea flava]MCP2327828.1 uncharacterized protein (TIGR02453 family) [Hamadaea flava]
MGFDGFPDEALIFYEGLLADNSKTYWTEHKDVYERAIKTPMLALIAELGDSWGEPKVFRPYRDVRFSADKSPYKTHQGAFCEILDGVGYYVQLDADGLTTGAGFHAHTREQTARYRAAVDSPATGPQLAKLVTSLVDNGFELSGDQVKTRPRGVAADHPRLALMRHESLVARRHHEPSPSLHTAAAAAVVRADWHALAPLVEWVATYVGEFTMPPRR